MVRQLSADYKFIEWCKSSRLGNVGSWLLKVEVNVQAHERVTSADACAEWREHLGAWILLTFARVRAEARKHTRVRWCQTGVAPAGEARQLRNRKGFPREQPTITFSEGFVACRAGLFEAGLWRAGQSVGRLRLLDGVVARLR